jgi:DNA repair protein RadC
MEAPHYHGHRQRLRERFLKSGFTGFAEHEIVELLLTLCIPRRDVKTSAKALLDRFGSLRAILDAPISDLQQTRGIGEVAPVALRVIREAASLYLQQRAEEATVLASPESLKSFWRSRLGGLRNEVFEVAYLDSASRLMRNGVETLEEGTVDRAAVYPRRVAEAALRRGAAALVVAHNRRLERHHRALRCPVWRAEGRHGHLDSHLPAH